MIKKINTAIKPISNRKKVKPVILKFLYEFAAIPRETRNKYLDKLTTCPVTGGKKKNGGNRKNVKLLKIIYHYIETGDMLGWDDERICRELDISDNMLYCHKSRLLKGLREFHFKWKEISGKEFHDRSDNKNDIAIRFAKAERMFEIGMRKEAKVAFLGIERKIRSKKRITTDEKLMLVKICYYLCSYYNANKKKIQLSKYYHRAEDLANKLKQKDSRSQNEAMLNYLYCKLFKTSENFKNEATGINEIELFREIYKLSIKLKDIKRQAEILLDISVACNIIKKHEIARGYIKKGIDLCRAHCMKGKELVFNALLLSNKLSSGKINAPESEESFGRLYEKFKRYKLDFFWRINFLLQGFKISSHWHNRTAFYNFAQMFTAEKINSLGFESSYRSLYFMKLDYYAYKMRKSSLEKDQNTGKEYITFYKDDEVWYRKLKNTFEEILMNFNRLKNIFLIHEIYIFMLIAESHRGINCDFDNTDNLIQKLNYLYRTRKIILHTKPIFENIKFQIGMLSDAKTMSRQIFLDKYEHKFYTEAEELANLDNPNVENSYSIYSFLAGQIGYPELKEIVKKLYWKLEEKHPGIFEPMLKKIRERERESEEEKSEFEEMAA